MVKRCFYDAFAPLLAGPQVDFQHDSVEYLSLSARVIKIKRHTITDFQLPEDAAEGKPTTPLDLDITYIPG